MKRQHEVEKRPLDNQHAIFTEPQGGEIQEHVNHRITIEEIASIDNLRMAVRQVRRNAGKGKSINKQANKRRIQSVCDNRDISKLRQMLLEGRYYPQPVQCHEIPKPTGGTRRIGIPEPVDRIVGTAISRVLQFHSEKYVLGEECYAYRPGKSASQAAYAAWRKFGEGYKWALKVDLSKYFDTIDHDILLQTVATKLKPDQATLQLINRILKAGSMWKGQFQPSRCGVPQGGVCSPVLSNLFGAVLDEALRKQGIIFVRYADDILVLARDREECEKQRDIIDAETRKLKLTLNREKTVIRKLRDITFLNYAFRKSGVRIPQGAYMRLSENLNKEVTKWESGIDRINHAVKIVCGWLNYYRQANSMLPRCKECKQILETIEKNMLFTEAKEAWNQCCRLMHI